MITGMEMGCMIKNTNGRNDKLELTCNEGCSEGCYANASNAEP